ncbi:hypothetical protein BABINDRAFT_159630 [Babjeviella inositovora NRRL Y-12698]|uniref:Origin recognition complex subunit 2 n=1 Tax=Babjeviella inositovora NRRL Y-12698 TaxID=984486 RepID=A0A1E3QZS1_9ASCO|nr:uncharacterized protein BABINDRAFT_159630 [Babjeviella inositovora NRRL Y-12698]ODQ83189.1 hypothetical protein BABINDRAFT_159630 [Babjeviella inositovora NRRL Y-12698]
MTLPIRTRAQTQTLALPDSPSKKAFAKLQSLLALTSPSKARAAASSNDRASPSISPNRNPFSNQQLSPSKPNLYAIDVLSPPKPRLAPPPGKDHGTPLRKQLSPFSHASPSKDVHLSPAKERAARWLLSPSKDRVFDSSPVRTPRRADPSLDIRSDTDLDRSARKRAFKALFTKLTEEDSESEEEIEKIIAASRDYSDSDSDYQDTSEIISTKNQSPTPKKRRTNLHHLLSKEEDSEFMSELNTPFVPTVAPLEDDESRKFDDRALFLDGSEGYFEQSKMRNKKTSGNTLLMLPSAADIDYQDFNQLVKLNRMLYFRERRNLARHYRASYTQWMFELSQGFNLMFYGVGSKRELVMEFVEAHFDLPVLVVNGYNPNTSFKEVITQIGGLFHQKLPKLPRDIFLMVTQTLNKQTPQLLLVVHNLDGEALRDDKTQSFLSQLCALPGISVILTIDHINAPVIWDAAKLSLFNFIWHDLTTFENYTVETSFRDALSVGKSSKFLGSTGASYVLSSLTDNARKLYAILLRYQLRAMSDDFRLAKVNDHKKLSKSSFKGKAKHSIEFKQLLQLCREDFVASNELNFRTMLVEFVEHKMLRLVKDKNGVEIVYIPFNYEEMSRLIEK